MTAPEQVVVVGAGLAGSRTCQELRRQGYQGRLTMVGAERHLPYDRPPLSKQVLAGELTSTEFDVDWAGLSVTVHRERVATGLRPGRLETDQGPLDADAFVLATGSQPIRLPGTGEVLRTIDDARRLRAALLPGARVVVVGAGWIGAEVATAAAGAGCRTTVLEAADEPLAVPLGQVGALTRGWYAAAGVDLVTGVQVTAVEPDRVVLADGSHVPADVTLVGIGARPDTGWLRDSGLSLDPGVVVDEHLATSWPGVVAVGDIASWWSPREQTRLRVEHWDAAMSGPEVAAGTLLGTPTVYDPVPYFWSAQLGHMLQFAGHRRPTDEVVLRGDPAERGWSACWLRDGRLVAVLATDRPRDLVQGRRRIAEGAAPDPSSLADLSVPLASA